MCVLAHISGDDNTQSGSEKVLDSEHKTDENESDSESDQEENKEEIGDDEEEEDAKFVRTSSNNSDDETKNSNKAEGDEDEDEDKEMDYNTSQLYDDVDTRLNKSVQEDDETVQKEDAEIVSPINVHVHHEVLSKQTLTLLTVPVSVITESSPIYSTVISQSIPSFTPPPSQSTPTQPPTTEATNPPSTLSDFASVFQFDNRVTALEKEVAKLKKDDPLKSKMTALVDEHLESRLGATRDEFMNFLSASITARIT
nr:hypothetical protein [Tanacetum cinerariifolium]